MPSQNVLLQSGNQNSASWTKINVTTAQNATDPTGVASSATTLTDSVDGAPASHIVLVAATGVSAAAKPVGSIWTMSVYAKAGTKDKIGLAPGSASIHVSFDLTNGVVGQVIGGTILSTSVVPQGSGWYRCSVTFAASAAILGFMTTDNRIYMLNTLSSSTYTGAGTGTLLVWGAELEQSNAAGEYLATTTVGINNGAPAFKRNAVNFILQSETHDSASWTKTNTTITPDIVVAPNGTTTGDKLVEDTANSTHFLRQTATIPQIRQVYSAWFQAAGRTKLVLSLGDNTTGSAEALIDLTAVTASVQQVTDALGLWTGVVAGIYAQGGGWYRAWIAAKRNAGSTSTLCRTYLYTSTHSYVGDGASGIYVWGSQHDRGNAPGDYVRTTTLVTQ